MSIQKATPSVNAPLTRAECDAFVGLITSDEIALIHAGLRHLAGMDADHGHLRNDQGFDRYDGDRGHELAERAALSPHEAIEGLRLLYKYRRQDPTGLHVLADLRARSAASGAAETEDAPDGALVVSGARLSDLTESATAALLSQNADAPRLFSRSGHPVRFVPATSPDPAERATLEPLTTDALRGEFARCARWVRMTQQGPKDVFPPMDVVRDFLALARCPLPPVTRLVHAPIFVRGDDGRAHLITTPGYHPESRVYLDVPTSLRDMRPVPEAPSPPDIAAARSLLDEVYGDFPFADQPSRAHAIALQCLPFVRDLIDGVTPWHYIDAPAPGTGKGLLVEAETEVATGLPALVGTEAESDAEYRKRITSLLLAGQPIIVLDNVNSTLASGTLAAAATARYWYDRLLSSNQMSALRNDATWIITGNNLTVSAENARRGVWVRLDAQVERPEDRPVTTFRHGDLIGWVRARRADLVWSVLTLIQAWVAATDGGTQVLDGVPNMASFGEWSQVIGGILAVAGIPGFLANMREFRAKADIESPAWDRFVAAWAEEFGQQPVSAGALHALCAERDLLADIRGNGNEGSQRSRLGRELTRKEEYRIGGYIIRRRPDGHTKTARYQLVQAEAATPFDEDLRAQGVSL